MDGCAEFADRAAGDSLSTAGGVAFGAGVVAESATGRVSVRDVAPVDGRVVARSFASVGGGPGESVFVGDASVGGVVPADRSEGVIVRGGVERWGELGAAWLGGVVSGVPTGPTGLLVGVD